MSKIEWEVVSGRGLCGDTCRMKVPGGWLYRERESGARDGCTTAVAMVFVPAPLSALEQCNNCGDLRLMATDEEGGL